MKKLLLASLIFACFHANAQVAIGTSVADGSAQLDVVSTTKGMLVPRMTLAQRTAIGSPAAGLMVYQTDDVPGFFIYKAGQWFPVLDANNGVKKSSAFVNSGVAVTLDDISVLLPLTGNKSLQIRSGTAISVSGSSINNYVSVTPPGNEGASTTNGYVWNMDPGIPSWPAGSYKYWQSGLNFTIHGSSQTIIFNDQTRKLSYRITMTIGNAFNNNFISIERL